MKVEEVFTSFTGQVNVGLYSYFIKIGKMGTNIPVQELVEKVKHFNTVVIFGNPFYDKEEIAKLVKLTTKVNKEIMFIIETKSDVYPNGLGTYMNIKFNVIIPLKKSNIPLEKRVNTLAIKWYVEAQSNFIFEIEKEDDIDEVKLLLNIISIPKRLVFLSVVYPDNMSGLLKKASLYKFNIAPDFKKFLWDDLDRDILMEAE